MSDTFFQLEAERQGLLSDRRQRLVKVADTVRASCLSHQLDVIVDKAKWKSVLCPRRSGKSWTAMFYALDVLLRTPQAEVVIVTLTLKSAKNIYWHQIEQMCKRHGVEIEMFKNDMVIDFPDGSRLQFVGAESYAQIEKLRGGKYDLVVIDESKSFAPYILDELINNVVGPALMDKSGTIMIIGTPGNILSGPFFEATYPGYINDSKRMVSKTFGKEEDYWKTAKHKPIWSRHTWTIKENTAAPNTWNNALELKDKNGWDDDNPTWRQEYLGEWVAMDSTFVYRFAVMCNTEPEKVLWTPDFLSGNQFGLDRKIEWRYVIGVDFGWHDDTAIVVLAYSPHDGCLREVYSWKKPHQDVDDVVNQLKDVISLCGVVDKIVGDTAGGSKQVVETLNKRYGWNIEPAIKRDKFDYIQIVNSDAQAGRVKIRKESETAFEMMCLQWDTRGDRTLEELQRAGKLKEDESFANHCCDAFLYAYKYSYHFWADDRPSLAVPGSAEWQQEQEDAAMMQLLQGRSSGDGDSFLESLKNSSRDITKELN